MRSVTATLDKADIPFTQFMLPDGRRVETSISRPTAIGDTAQRLIESGHEFQVEMLTTGEISVTCFNVADEQDIAIEICPNGPEVPLAVDKVVAAAAEVVDGAVGREGKT